MAFLYQSKLAEVLTISQDLELYLSPRRGLRDF